MRIQSVLFALLLCNCARTTSDQLHARATLEAIRDHGTAPVCGRPSASAFTVTGEWLEAMTDGLFALPDQRKATTPLRECMVRLFETLDASEAETARETLLEVFVEAVPKRHAAGLDTLAALLMLTTSPVPFLEKVREAAYLFDHQKPPKPGSRLAAAFEAWRGVLDLMQGLEDGVPITEGVIVEAEDEARLFDYARFLPGRAMQQMAERRIVQLRLHRGEYPELSEGKSV